MNSTPNADTSGEQRGPEDDLVSEDPDLSTGEDPTIDEGPAAEAPDEDGLGMADAPTDQPDGDGGADLSEDDPDLGVPDMAATKQPNGDADPSHPSQAEGEDASDPADAQVQPEDGHPSQAEG